MLFFFLGLRAPVFWGVIMAMLSLLPLVGPAIVWAPAAIYPDAHWFGHEGDHSGESAAP